MDIDIFQLPGILKRRAHYVVLTVLACLLLAMAFLATQKPYFRSTAEILLDLNRGSVVGTGGSANGQVSAQQSVAVRSKCGHRATFCAEWAIPSI